MSHLLAKRKYQVTIPASTMEAAGIHEEDALEARAVNGGILLATQLIHRPIVAKQKKRHLSKWIGSMAGIYGNSPQEADEYIRKERDSWG